MRRDRAALKGAISSGRLPISLTGDAAEEPLLAKVFAEIDCMSDDQARRAYACFMNEAWRVPDSYISTDPNLLISKAEQKAITKLARNGAQTELIGWSEATKGVLTPVIRVSR